MKRMNQAHATQKERLLGRELLDRGDDDPFLLHPVQDTAGVSSGVRHREMR